MKQHLRRNAIYLIYLLIFHLLVYILFTCSYFIYLFVFFYLFIFYLPVYLFPSQHSVVKIVREKYMKTTAFHDKDELQQFLSELYVYLVDEMHVVLHKVRSTWCTSYSYSAISVNLLMLTFVN